MPFFDSESLYDRKKNDLQNPISMSSHNKVRKYILTSILKVLLKQYMSPTGPNKYWRGITPTKADKLELDL